MHKLYLFLIVFTVTLSAKGQSDPVCKEDVVYYTKEGCGMDVGDLDLQNAEGLKYEFTLEGATTGKGEGSATDNFFNVGKTTVTYRYPDGTVICQFNVTVINPTVLELDREQLDTLYLSCRREVTERPTIFEHCTGQHYEAETEDSLVFYEKGTFHITWIYYFGGEPIKKQQQTVIVSDERKEFIPNNYKLPRDTIYCKGVVEAPFGYYGCSAEQIFATTTNQTKFDEPGDYEIGWVYRVDSEAVYKQMQNVTVINNGTLIPDKKSLATVTGTCEVIVKDTPFAKNNCSGAIAYGRTKDPLVYTKPGTYKIGWEFGFIGIRSGIIRDTQIVEVKNGGPIVLDSKSLTTYSDSCSVMVVDTPTAHINCGTTMIKGTPRGPLTFTDPGTHTIEWVFNDNYKHSLTQKQEVIILGDNRLQVEKLLLDTIKGDCSLTVTDAPYAKNRCTDERIKATTTDPLVFSGVGEYRIRWLFQQGKESLTQEQIILVQAKDSLVPLKDTLAALSGNCEVIVNVAPQAKNVCTGKIVTGTTTSDRKYSSPGNNIITWVFNDGTARLVQRQAVVVDEMTVSLKVYPNPTDKVFKLKARSCNSNEDLTLRVYDAIGRLIETRTKLPFNQEILFGAEYPGRSYFAQVTWGDRLYLYKLVKNK